MFILNTRFFNNTIKQKSPVTKGIFLLLDENKEAILSTPSYEFDPIVQEFLRAVKRTRTH